MIKVQIKGIDRTTMYITDITHFLDGKGSIPKEMPKEARELASFFALVVDTTTKTLPQTLITTDIRCFKKGCDGMIKSELVGSNSEIHWKCSKCPNEGVISGWKGTKWDIRSANKP